MDLSVHLLRRRIAGALQTRSEIASEPSSEATSSPHPQAVIDLSDITAIADDEQFLKEAYRRILGRECDISGLVSYLELLRKHAPRRVILTQLVNSDEAKKRDIRFSGVQALGASSTVRKVSYLRFFPARLAAVVRETVRRILFTRFDSIDHKLNFILREVATRSDAITAKTDVALWTLSEKLDKYVTDVLKEHHTAHKQLCDYEIKLRKLDEKVNCLSRELHAITTSDATKVDALSTNQGILAADLGSLRTAVTSLHAFAADSLGQVTRRLRSPIIAAGTDVLVTELDGLIVGVPGNEWRMAAYHAFRGSMEPGATKLFCSLVKPGDVVVDVGANVGLYTLLAARLLRGSGRIYSFEPTPRTYRILKDNLQVNGFLELGSIKLHQLAVTDRAGLARLATFTADCGHNTLFRDGEADGEVDVTTISLDEALCAEKQVDLVKIDVEGAEPLVLKGMQRLVDNNPHMKIIMEFAPVHLRRAGFDPAAVLDSLCRSGFQVRRINDLTGDLTEITSAELCEVTSANILLVRN